MEHYAVWAHQLFPRLKFGDFIAAMESTTKKRSMRHFLDVELDKYFGYATEEPLTAAQPDQPPSEEEGPPVKKTDDLADIDDAEFGTLTNTMIRSRDTHVLQMRYWRWNGGCKRIQETHNARRVQAIFPLRKNGHPGLIK